MDFATVQRLLVQGATPDRAQIVRAKRLVVESLQTGSLTIGDLDKRHRAAEGAGVNFGELQLADMSDDDLAKLLGRDHAQVAGMRARVAIEVAVAELVASGLVLGLALEASAGAANPSFSLRVTMGSRMFSREQTVDVEVDRPLLFAVRYGLAAGIAGPTAWRFTVDGFVDGLTLDPRALRCADEAFKAYVRGAYLAAASLLGAVVEGAWYAAAERRRSTVPALVQPLDRDQTAQVQKELCTYFRSAIRRAWRVDDLERDARLFREVRNYGVHPWANTSPDVERHLHEDTCGLIIAAARDHLVTLDEVDKEAP